MPALKKAILPLFILFLIAFLSFGTLIKKLAGDFEHDIARAKKKLSPEAKTLIDQTFSGLENSCVVDFHVHAVGIGANNSGAWINPSMTSLLAPKHFFKYKIYSSASGISGPLNADTEYIDRLVSLHEAEPRLGKLLLFAFDYHYDESGKKDPARSSFHIPNDHVLNVAAKYPHIFIPVASIHPYRKDALAELYRVAAKGIRFIKWLPNSQRIDALDERSLKFMEAMKDNDMTLITHTGHEKAVEGEEFQKLGNPLRFRKALDMGVRIIMAHLASLGECVDLDRPQNGKLSCFQAFVRLMSEDKYKDNLYGETSAITLYTRIGEPIDFLLNNPDMAHRFVHGSDYPLPAINVLYRPDQMRELGYITELEAKLLKEIYRYNPLLFNFVTKRIIKHPKSGEQLRAKLFTGKELVSCKN